MKKIMHTNLRSMRVPVLAALCAASVAISGCGAATAGTGSTAVTATAAEISRDSQTAPAADAVTVSAKGSVYAAPDLAELQFGVRTQAGTAPEAQAQNSKDVEAVLRVLKENKIKEENIQTTWYDVSPQYDWNTGNGDTIIGYIVNTYLSVKGVSIDEAGKIISACTEAGANEFNGISYSCSNYDDLYAQAQQKAVETSREKAETLAKAAGRSLGSVTAIVEGWQDTNFEPNLKTMSGNGVTAGEAAYDESGSASLMPGQAQVTATVTVTYVLN